MKKSILIITSVALLALTQACFDPYQGGICVSGVGEIVKQEITLDPINAVSSETVVDVEIVQGDEQKVVVEGHENMIEELSLSVIDGELKIDLKNHCYNRFNMKVFLTLPDLKSIEVKSTGDVTLGGFSKLSDLELSITSTGDIIGEGQIEVAGLTEIKSKSTGRMELELTTTDLIADLSGTGNVELVGNCTKQTIDMDGTGNYKAFEFESAECDIECGGVGSAKIFVTDELKAVINSVGDIYVKGSPRISIFDNSVGDLISVDE
jgi:hypothetical protein